MARVLGVDLPRNKEMRIAIRSIYGIGAKLAVDVLNESGIELSKNSSELNEEEVQAIRNVLESGFAVEGDLRRETSLSIKRLIDLATYRGSRHRKKLPVRGQRTRCNSRTRKGKAIAIAGKKLTPLKK